MQKINWPLVAAVIVMSAILVFLFNVRVSVAQEHHGHPQQDMAIHEQFYSTWMMPDNRKVSCCSKEDCSPAESKFENGQWWARKVEDKDEAFTRIPASKVEQERDNPDGRSHLCGRRWGGPGSDLAVFCFSPGSGT